MPPDPKKQLTQEEIASLKAWVSALPALEPNQTATASKSNSWVADYLTKYQRSRPSILTPPPNLSVSKTIDWFLTANWKRNKIQPSSRTDDATFGRRVSLDIAGRIPTKNELKLFLSDTPQERRTKLVDRLLASDDYPRRFRELFDATLMGRPDDKMARERDTRGWNAFLESSFKSNRPWNETVRDILLARSATGERKGAFWFLAEKNNSHQAMAEAVAPLVFGVQIKCAQCHNHPLVWEIEQKHYWGLVTAFNRSKNIETEMGLGLAESATGGFINFANLKKESQPALMVFLNGKSVSERIPGNNEKEMDSPNLYLTPPSLGSQKPATPPVPKFSRREAFADSVTQENPQLSRALVNRVWGALMGRGIVHPIDQIDSRHRPSHPELLNWLSQDFEKSNYDIKRLVRNIVLSNAYQLDSKPSGKTVPRTDSFARAIEKPLTAEQLLRSLLIATETRTDPQTLSQWERAFVVAFPEVMPETYNPSLQQALYYTNSPLLNTLLKPTQGNLTSRLMALLSPKSRVYEAYHAILGRSPDATELQQCLAFLKTQSPEKGSRNLLWALVTSTEFQVNH
jgi:hypothetical protein